MAAEEKTEKATPKRQRDERKKGHIFQSNDLTSVLSLLVVFNALKLVAPHMYRYLVRTGQIYFSYASELYPLTASDFLPKAGEMILLFCMIVMPILLVSMVSGIIFTVAQTRLLFSADALKFKVSRLNPLQGIKRMISLRSVVELLKAIIKTVILGYVLYTSIKKQVYQYPRLMDGSLEGALAFIGTSFVSLVNTVGVIFVVLGAFDYLYQWWDYNKQMKMTKQEVKEEYKQTEGDPQIKGKIKEKQRQMASMRMMQKVPEADVIIRNPTHFAVAIAYDSEKNRAPVVVAKGADRIALKIVEIGEANGVYITENKPLARGLYDGVELDMEIPADFYQAVAAVLAFVYKMKNKKV